MKRGYRLGDIVVMLLVAPWLLLGIIFVAGFILFVLGIAAPFIALQWVVDWVYKFVINRGYDDSRLGDGDACRVSHREND